MSDFLIKTSKAFKISILFVLTSFSQYSYSFSYDDFSKAKSNTENTLKKNNSTSDINELSYYYMDSTVCAASNYNDEFIIAYNDLDGDFFPSTNDTIDIQATACENEIDYTQKYYLVSFDYVLNIENVYSITFSGDETQGYTITVGNTAEDTAACTDDSSDDSQN